MWSRVVRDLLVLSNAHEAVVAAASCWSVANVVQMSVNNDDTCDELNQDKVAGKLPISNSCGQRGLSYQDMACADDPAMACPVDPAMTVVAVTADRTFGAPPALTCAPQSEVPWTGYFDFTQMKVDDRVAYANANARVDVEGCCWWGRGALQIKGTCAFGRLNHYIGKRGEMTMARAAVPGTVCSLGLHCPLLSCARSLAGSRSGLSSS